VNGQNERKGKEREGKSSNVDKEEDLAPNPPDKT